MKKRIIPVCAIALASAFMFSSCIGNFALTRKVLDWNQQVGNKFVNELVFFGFWILPVYEITTLADLVIINSVEFWSGSNPIAQGQKVVEGETGNYLVAWDESGYTITNQEDNSQVRLKFNQENNSWAVETEEGDITFLTYVDDNHVKMPTADGSSTVVELSQEGVLAYKALAAQSSDTFLAKK